MARITRRSWNFAVYLVGVLALSATPSLAEPWPQRAIRLIEPNSAGSGVDIPARLFAERLAERWKQPVVIENRPGADGIIGVAAFAAMHDDHTLLYSPAAPISVFPVTQGKLPYDPVLDVVPIASAVDTFAIVAVPASLKIDTLSELVTLARAQPGGLNYNATGGGAFTILAAGFARSMVLDMVPISYRDSIRATQDLAEGRIQVVFATLTSVLPLVQAGKVRVLAVTNRMRAPIAPQVPTAMEAGYPDLAFEGLQGFFGPRDMPAERRDRIAADIRAVAIDATVADRLPAIGQVAHGSTPAEFAAAIEEQRAKIASIVKMLGIKPTQ